MGGYMKFFKSILSLALVIMMLFVAGCATSESNKSKGVVRLGTMTDEEGRIIGSMMEQLLIENGYEVDSRVGTFNNSILPRQSVEQNQVDISLDYTGRGMLFIPNVDITKYQSDLETAYITTKEADEANGIIWLDYAPFNNTDGIAVTREWSEKNNVKSLVDFAKFVNDGGTVKLAINGPNSYVVSAETCLPGWQKAYGFELSQEQVVVGVQDAQSMAAGNIDGVTATHVYTTSGVLDALDLVVLEDLKVVSPVYSPAPIVSKAFYEAHPDIKDIFEPLFKSIDENTARHLNKLVSTDGLSEKDVAREYLLEKGFVK